MSRCTCPAWAPTDRDTDGTLTDYCCPDDDCRCARHCVDDSDPWLSDAEAELLSLSWAGWRDRAKAAEAEVELLTAALADRDRRIWRIEKALHEADLYFPDLYPAVYRVVRILRGESG